MASSALGSAAIAPAQAAGGSRKVVLHIIADLTTGGAELALKRLVTAFRDDPDYEHRVISLKSRGTVGPQIEAAGILLEAMAMGSLASLPAAAFRLRKQIRSIRPTVVQTWMYHADLIGGLAARASGCPNVLWGVRTADAALTEGSSPLTRWVRKACALLSKKVPERIVYVAEASRRLHETLGYDPTKSVVIPNGYLINPPATRTAIDAVRAEFDVSQEAVLIGSAGRFNAQKDHRTFIQAAALVAQRYPKATFLLMGPNVTEANSELMAWVNATPYRDRFRIVGERSDVERCLAALDIFSLHSIIEGFPNVVAEAMAAGVPCVVTDVGDAAFLVQQLGEIVPPGRPSDLADAIGKLIDMGYEDRSALGRLARLRIAEQFSVDAVTGQYRALYDALSSNDQIER